VLILVNCVLISSGVDVGNNGVMYVAYAGLNYSFLNNTIIEVFSKIFPFANVAYCWRGVLFINFRSFCVAFTEDEAESVDYFCTTSVICSISLGP
jgi:hypothetical protein